jgi:hypothetical protein
MLVKTVQKKATKNKFGNLIVSNVPDRLQKSRWFKMESVMFEGTTTESYMKDGGYFECKCARLCAIIWNIFGCAKIYIFTLQLIYF